MTVSGPNGKVLKKRRGSPRGKRTMARELVLQALYQHSLGGDHVHFIIEQWRLDPEVRGADFAYFEQLFRGIIIQIDELDGWIEKTSSNWPLDRVSIVDRNVLRIGIYELLMVASVPTKVVINEGVELSKRFGGENSGRFINGILDELAKVISDSYEVGSRPLSNE